MWSRDVMEIAVLTEATTQMQRMAVGTFVDAHQLTRAVGALSAVAIEPHQYCFIGTSGNVAAATERSGDNAILRAPRDGIQFVAVPALPHGIDFESELQADGLLHGLDAALSDGAVALLVNTRTVAEFIAATQILLRYSSLRVRTREIGQCRCR